MLAHPPAAIVAAGGTGELYSLTPAEHLEVVRTIVEECGGRRAGDRWCRLQRVARGGAGAGRRRRPELTGMLVFPPYYPNADEEGVLDYYRRIAAATARRS